MTDLWFRYLDLLVHHLQVREVVTGDAAKIWSFLAKRLIIAWDSPEGIRGVKAKVYMNFFLKGLL